MTGLSQAKVAARLGIKPPSVAQWELGRSKPGIDKLIPLARLYGVSLAELCGDDIPMGAAVDPGAAAYPPSFGEKQGQFVEDADELSLLAFWRALDRDERHFMLSLVRNGALARKSA